MLDLFLLGIQERMTEALVAGTSGPWNCRGVGLEESADGSCEFIFACR